ncbi:MAG: M28 family peptidase, partial [Bacteroidales bacterium]|nr:M28 family peptidase [Bacteroidales bacterium]
SQAKLLGLKPANGQSYFQPFTVIRKSIDQSKTKIQVIEEGKEPVTIARPIVQWLPDIATLFSAEEEVVFAGYGIKAEKYNYNDFENVQTEGKILLVMNRGPLSEDGKKFLFDDTNWNSFMNIQLKLMSLMSAKAKAIIMVMDPKSGNLSVHEQYPGISAQLSGSMYMKGGRAPMMGLPGMTNLIFVHRDVADELLKGTGYSLESLQKEIDLSLKPHSFVIPGKKLRIDEFPLEEEKTLNNVAAYLEGSDSVLKDEVVIFSCHSDHVGEIGGQVYCGADDNATGCAALLEIADAFSSLPKLPLRSVLFLWVAGEEIGLYGSKWYTENPLFPLEKTVADLNIDMIGRTKSPADTLSDTPMTGPTSVFVITGYQSKELVKIADDIDKKSVLDFDYSLSGRNHPLQLFSRSDHYNFVKKDIPVLFFSTGIHTDYHQPGDVVEKIEFTKMELIVKAIYEIGFTVANQKSRIVVDNPFSKW